MTKPFFADDDFSSIWEQSPEAAFIANAKVAPLIQAIERLLWEKGCGNCNECAPCGSGYGSLKEAIRKALGEG